MKNIITKQLREILEIPSLRIPKNIVINDNEINLLKNVKWNDLKIEDLGGKGNIAHLSIKFPFKTLAGEGIVVDIQIINGVLYQIHIHMAKPLQNLGLGYKIYKAIIFDFGHLYSGKGRRMNPFVTNIWNKLKNDPDIECVSNNNGDLCSTKNNPDKDELFNFVR